MRITNDNAENLSAIVYGGILRQVAYNVIVRGIPLDVACQDAHERATKVVGDILDNCYANATFAAATDYADGKLGDAL